MAPPIKILEAVWSGGYVHLVFPNTEEREKILETTFILYRNTHVIAKGRTIDFIPPQHLRKSIQPYEVEGSNQCGLYLDIGMHFQWGKNGYVMDPHDMFNPLLFVPGNKLEFFYKGEKFNPTLSEHTRAWCKWLGLPIPEDAT